MKKNVAVIGFYQSYPRNRVLLEALKTQFTVSATDIPKGRRFKNITALSALAGQLRLADAVLFVWPAQLFLPSMAVLKLLFRKKIVFDAFVSLYDSTVFDRKIVHKTQLKAFYYYMLDYLCCRCADILIFDTGENARYFFQAFKLRPHKKKLVLQPSVDLNILDAVDPADNYVPGTAEKIRVLFYGSFIPLHGIQYIIKAAHLLQNTPAIHFIMIGSGQTRSEMLTLSQKLMLRNITFIDSVEYTELIAYIKQAHLCLGIFGDTEKARRVIPNKVIECMGCCKPVITGRNLELEHFFSDGEEIIFCNMADEHDLADKINYCAGHFPEMNRLGTKAREKVAARFSTRNLAEQVQELERML